MHRLMPSVNGIIAEKFRKLPKFVTRPLRLVAPLLPDLCQYLYFCTSKASKLSTSGPMLSSSLTKSRTCLNRSSLISSTSRRPRGAFHLRVSGSGSWEMRSRGLRPLVLLPWLGACCRMRCVIETAIATTVDTGAPRSVLMTTASEGPRERRSSSSVVMCLRFSTRWLDKGTHSNRVLIAPLKPAARRPASSTTFRTLSASVFVLLYQ